MRRLHQLRERIRAWGQRAFGVGRLPRRIRRAAAVAGIVLAIVVATTGLSLAGERTMHAVAGRAVVGHAVPRIVDHHAVGPVVGVAVPRHSVMVPLYRPYYVFRPRVYVGLGVWAGYPVAFPYVYGYPYPYPYPYPVPAYGYPLQGASAGVSFDITPSDASVFVDGTLVGGVSNFSPTATPLTLAPGRHHIEVRAPGYKTLNFDVDAVAGQMIPYHGALEREGLRS